MLKSDRKHDGGIASSGVGRRVALVVVQKDFAKATIRESADGAGVAQPAGLEVEVFQQRDDWGAVCVSWPHPLEQLSPLSVH